MLTPVSAIGLARRGFERSFSRVVFVGSLMMASLGSRRLSRWSNDRR